MQGIVTMNSTANNATSATTHAEFFLAVSLDLKTIIGRKEAESKGCRTTAEVLVSTMPTTDFIIPKEFLDKVQELASFFGTMVPKNEFEQNVVGHTLESLRLGRVEPRSAAFVVWAGKIWRDRLAAVAAQAEIAKAGETLVVGKTTAVNAVFQGCKRLMNNYGIFFVHSFLAEDGKVLEWWTDRNHGSCATNPDAPKEGQQVTLTCRFKKPNIWRGQVTYRVTHVKMVAV